MPASIGQGGGDGKLASITENALIQIEKSAAITTTQQFMTTFFMTVRTFTAFCSATSLMAAS
jgi:hypothetical protein